MARVAGRIFASEVETPSLEVYTWVPRRPGKIARRAAMKRHSGLVAYEIAARPFAELPSARPAHE